MESSHAVLARSSVKIPADKVVLEGDLMVPKKCRAAIIFAHGSGSSRYSSRNCYVAEILNAAGFATLLVDLLTGEEEKNDRIASELRFNVPLLAERVIAATVWLKSQPNIGNLPIGYFGASTGVAAALIAAAKRPKDIFTVVSRGGRPDLAGQFLADVQAPTLLLVGGDDDDVIILNKKAARHMRFECHLQIIPGATHLFEEAGALEDAAQSATDWFIGHLPDKTAALPYAAN